MSRAVRLRHQALKLAQSDNFNLLSKMDMPSRVASHLAELAAADAIGGSGPPSMLLVGGSTPGLTAEIGERDALAGAAVQVLKHHACAGSNGAGANGTDASSGADAGGPGPVVHGDLSDYALDPDRLEQELADHAPSDSRSYLALVERVARLKARAPWMPDDHLDVVVQDLTANLLDPQAWRAALAESLRVLKREGVLCVIALVSDEPFGEAAQPLDWGEGGPLRRFPQESELFETLEAAGFHGMSLQPLADMPVALVEGRELRAFAVTAYKGKAGACLDQGHAVVYRGPWREVRDDDGHTYRRGARTAVCAKTYELLLRAPYRHQFLGLPCSDPPALEAAPPFDCNTPTLRDPAVTKGRRPIAGGAPATPAASDGDCCDADAGSCCEPAETAGCC